MVSVKEPSPHPGLETHMHSIQDPLPIQPALQLVQVVKKKTLADSIHTTKP